MNKAGWGFEALQPLVWTHAAGNQQVKPKRDYTNGQLPIAAHMPLM
jgi:hypothetical protein